MRATLSRRPVLALASVLLAVALLQLLSGSSEQAIGVSSKPAPARAAQVAGTARSQSRPKPRQLAAPEARALFAAARRAADASNAKELFAVRSWYAPPPPPPPPPPAPVEAPTAPALPYRFLGAYADESGPTVYFITRDDRVYDVKPGDTLDQVYSVDAVQDGQLVFTYKPLNVRQLLPMGEGN